MIVAGIAILVLLATPVVFASQSNQGFAAYRISVTFPSGEHSVLVDETLRPSDRAGFSTLILELTDGEQNLTYSRLVNASTNLLPYLPSLPSQSFDYSNGTRYSIHVNFSSSGTAVVTFRGTQYILNEYSITVLASYGNRSVSAEGTVETFPSGLVYSATANGNGKIELQALLQATDLPLADPAPQTAAAAYVGAGIGVGGLALAAALLVRRRERKVKSQEQKPMHWVD